MKQKVPVNYETKEGSAQPVPFFFASLNWLYFFFLLLKIGLPGNRTAMAPVFFF